MQLPTIDANDGRVCLLKNMLIILIRRGRINLIVEIRFQTHKRPKVGLSTRLEQLDEREVDAWYEPAGRLTHIDHLHVGLVDANNSLHSGVDHVEAEGGL